MKRMRYIVAGLFLLLAGLLVFQRQQQARLRGENEDLQHQLAQAKETIQQPKSPQVSAAELERLRRTEHDVLRLRGEVTRLRGELQAALRQADQMRQSQPATNHWTTGFEPLQTTVQAEVPNGRTLAAGGWPGHEGNRLLLLATPRIAGEPSDQVEIEINAIEATDAFLAKLGLAGMNAAGDAGRFQQVLSAPQTEAIMKALAEAPNKPENDPDNFTRSLYLGSVRTANGQEVSLDKPLAIQDDSWSMGGNEHPQPGENLKFMGLDVGPYAGPPFVVLPVMSGDNTSVNLRFQGTIFKRSQENP